MESIFDLLTKDEAPEPLTLQDRAYCKLVAQGVPNRDALLQSHPGLSDRERRKKAPLLAQSRQIVAEIARLQLLRPDERLLERTEALIEAGGLRPERELEAIEFVSAQRERLYKEREVVKTPADLDEFIRGIVSNNLGMFA